MTHSHLSTSLSNDIQSQYLFLFSIEGIFNSV